MFSFLSDGNKENTLVKLEDLLNDYIENYKSFKYETTVMKKHYRLMF